ncbi:MAG: phosphoribosylamine--glycine ligase [Polyangiaceae bacterium]
MKVLVVGSGGREHALALALSRSPSVDEVIVCPGNGGTELPAGQQAALRNHGGAPLEVARLEQPRLVVIGPEAPLCAGLADELRAEGFATFGPSRQAAQLEGSKVFMKEFAARTGLPTARSITVTSAGELESALTEFPAPPVVKADGLCAGKGVTVADSHDQAREVALAMLSGSSFGEAGRRVVLEERLQGQEASVHAICDGHRMLVLPVAQDHKRLLEGDQGPNTGGMGTYAPAPLVTPALAQRIREQILEPAVAGLAQEGTPFCGALFAGLMIDGEVPRLLEFNVRFGDPETQVLMALLDGDLARLLHSAATGALDANAVRVSKRHALCVVIAAGGYPGHPAAGEEISGLDAAARVPGVTVLHAGTRREGERVLTAGGRVLGVTATADSLGEARARAYQAVDQIRFDGMQLRRDIAVRALGPS